MGGDPKGSLWPKNKKERQENYVSLPFSLVGVAGFEPTTFRSQSGRATKLRYTPIFI